VVREELSLRLMLERAKQWEKFSHGGIKGNPDWDSMRLESLGIQRGISKRFQALL
jgi:hypothetical protein